MNKHFFALYYSLLGGVSPGEHISIIDSDFLRRVQHVLRIKIGDTLILFNRAINIRCQVSQLEKKRLLLVVEKVVDNSVLNPSIAIALPLLKKEAFEQALYSCIELGASEIIPYYSQKTHRKNLTSKERDRADSIMIAAAEQSKYFSFPKLSSVVSVDEVMVLKGQKIFFDPDGSSTQEVVAQAQGAKKTLLLLGPEGDLTQDEKDKLKSADFMFCSLTPTILRARQAAAIGLGIFRSFLA